MSPRTVFLPLSWTRVGLIILLLLGLGRNLLFVSEYPDDLAPFNLRVDADLYDLLGRRLAETADFSSLFSQPVYPPGFPVLLATIYRISGHNLLVPKLLFCFLIFLTSLGVWLIGSHFECEIEGMIAALLVTASPLLQAFAATIQFEVFVVFLVTWTLLVFFRTLRAGSDRWATAGLIAVAILCGLGTLTRELLLLIFLFLCLAYLIHRPTTWRRRLIEVTAVGILFSAIIGSWSLYYYLQTDQFMFLSTKGGIVFRIGNNPNATGTHYLSQQGIAEPSGIAFILHEPAAALKVTARKFLYFWGFLKDGWNVPRPTAVMLSRLTFDVIPLDWILTLVRGGFWAILCFVGMPYALSRVKQRYVWIPIALIFVVLGVSLLYFSAHRYAVPVFPLIFFFAAFPLTSLARASARFLSPRAAVVLAAGLGLWVVLASFVNPPGRLRLEAEELEGFNVVDQLDSSASAGMTRFVPSSEGPRQGVFMTEEFFPAGGHRVAVRFRSACSGDTPLFRVKVPIDSGGYARGGYLLDRQIRCTPAIATGAYVSEVMDGYLISQSVVRVELWTDGEADLWIDQVRIEYGLPMADLQPSGFQPEVSGIPFSLDIGEMGQDALWLGQGFSGPEQMGGDGLSFRWATGSCSVVYLPISEAVIDRHLNLQATALPFNFPGAEIQGVQIFLNEMYVTETPLKSEGWQEFEVGLPRIGLERFNVLRLCHSRSVSPHAAGVSADRRNLAVAYDRLILQEQQD